ncbi:MAG: hypothetical protein JXR63_12830 [Spirochaetales bacterium]|nr:hypothetical protein [Spirochaetales bacterium]
MKNLLLVSCFFLIFAATSSCDFMKFSYSEDSFYYAKAKFFPKKLYLIDSNSMSREESELIASLQGNLAKSSESNIYVLPGNGIYLDLLDFFKEKGTVVQQLSSAEEALSLFKDSISGYLIWKSGDSSSLNNAFSLAGIKNALVVEEGLIPMAEKYGLKLIEDLRGSNQQDIFRANKEFFNKKLVVELDPGIRNCLRDYAVLADAFVFFDEKPLFRSEIYRNMYPDSVVMGWGHGEKGEDTFVAPSSRSGLHYIAANFAYNLSVLSSDRVENFEEYGVSPDLSGIKLEENVHTVCLVMSDGDNLQWNLNGYMNDARWYGSPDRGNFPMGWGVAPCMYDLAPSALDFFYANSSENDGFVLYTGTGYMYPSKYPAFSLQSNLLNLDNYLKKLDLSIVQIIDFNSFGNILLWKKYADLKNLQGLFYLEYSNHAMHKGAVKWISGKPVVTPRYMLWDGLDGCDNDTVVSSVNSGSRDVYSTDSYSLIVVHAWSKDMSDIQDVVSRFKSDVRVVTPEVFVQLLKLAID